MKQFKNYSFSVKDRNKIVRACKTNGISINKCKQLERKLRARNG